MTTTAQLFIECKCSLGEGIFWHPGRRELFWFDINAGALYRADAAGDIQRKITFGQPVSAAALIDDKTLLVAGADALLKVGIEDGTISPLIPFEADNPITRSNDARVSPQGAWWVSTMGRNEETGAGALYRFVSGELTPILTEVSIPNAICFAPDGRRAYFTDTPTRKIKTVALDPETALPIGEWEVFVDLSGQKGAPDGAVTDAEGFVWSAEYGGGRVVRYAPDGSVDRVVSVPAQNVTCPTFGGDDLKTLYVTTARQNLSEEDLRSQPLAGSVFAIDLDVAGRPEVPVRL